MSMNGPSDVEKQLLVNQCAIMNALTILLGSEITYYSPFAELAKSSCQWLGESVKKTAELLCIDTSAIITSTPPDICTKGD